MKKSLKGLNYLKVWIWVFFLTALILGISFRSVEILSGNFLFGYDQGRDYLAVRTIVEDIKPTLIGSEIGAGAAGLNGIFHGPFHYYFLSVPYLLMGGNPYGGMLLMFLYSITTLVILFILGRNLFGMKGGLFIAGLAAMSPPLISQARFIWNSHGAPVFVMLTLFFAYRICQDSSYRNVFLSSFFAAFIYNFQLAIAIPVSISLVILFTVILRVRDVRKYLVLITGFIIGFLPMILFEIRHNFMAVRGLANYLLGPNESDSPGLLFNMNSHIPSFMSNLHNTFIRQEFISGEVIGLFLLAGVVFFLVREKNKTLKNFVIFLASIPFVTFFVLGFLGNSVWDYYLLHLVCVYLILLTYILFSALKNKNKLILLVVIGFITISLIILTPKMIDNIVYDYHDYGGTHKMEGKTAAIDYVYSEMKGEEFGLFVTPIFYKSHDFLIEWYAFNKYGYKPTNTKEITFYLLYEEIATSEDLQDYWLDTEIGDVGNVIYEKDILNGFTIQKREIN